MLQQETTEKANETCSGANEGNLKCVLFLLLGLLIIDYFSSKMGVSVNYQHSYLIATEKCDIIVCELQAIPARMDVFISFQSFILKNQQSFFLFMSLHLLLCS